MDSNSYRVSVILCVFNGEKYISEAIESAIILNEVDELIIIDDGSTDLSLSICKDYQKTSTKIKIFHHQNKANLGLAASRNLGITKTKSELIAFLDADDYYFAHRFKKDIEIFEEYDHVDAVFSCTVHFDNISKNMGMIYGAQYDPREKYGYNLSPNEFNKLRILHKWNLFNNLGITLKKEFLLRQKLFDSRLVLHQDTELWARLFKYGNFYAGEFNDPVAAIRKHNSNSSLKANSKSKLRMLSAFLDNVGFNNLAAYEIDDIFIRILRERSKIKKRHWERRLYFYFLYAFNYLRKEKLFQSTISKYL